MNFIACFPLDIGHSNYPSVPQGSLEELKGIRGFSFNYAESVSH